MPGEHQRARLAGERAALLGVHRLRTDARPPGRRPRATSRSQIVGGQITVVTERRLGRGDLRPPAARAIASSAVGGFIFQLPATTGRRISPPRSLASSTSRRRRWLTADRLTPSAAPSVSRSASGMRRRIAAVSRSAGASAARPPIRLEPIDGRQLAVGGADRARQVRLLGVQQPVQPGSHVAPDPLRLELEHAAVRADQAQQRDDLLVPLQVDDVAAAPLRPEALARPARRARPGASCGRHRGRPGRTRRAGPMAPNEIEPDAEQHAAQERATVAGRRVGPRPGPEPSRSSSTTRWWRAPTPHAVRGDRARRRRPAARASRPGARPSGRWRGRACADDPRGVP